MLRLRAGSLPEAKLVGARPTRSRAAVGSAVAVPAADSDDHVDPDLPEAPANAVASGVEVVDEDGTEPRALAADAPAPLHTKESEEPTPEEIEALSADLPGIDDSVRMYLKDIGTAALLTAEEEVVLAKAIELGEQLVEAPGKGIVSLHEWTTHDTEHKTRTAKPRHRLPFGPEAHAMVRAAISDEATADLLAPTPDFHLFKAGAVAGGDHRRLPDADRAGEAAIRAGNQPLKRSSSPTKGISVERVTAGREHQL